MHTKRMLPAVALLAYGVVAWEQTFHIAILGHRPPSDWMLHLMLDGTLALVPATMAVLAGARLAGLIGRQSVLARAGAVALLFGVLLVPSAAVHVAIDARLQPSAHAHGSVAAPGMTHAARDAAVGLLAALPLAALGLALGSTSITTRLPRRRWAPVAIALVALGPTVGVPQRARAESPPLPIPPVLTDPEITLTAAQTEHQIFSGSKTKLWTFNGSFPGPTIRRPSGQPTHVTVGNDLPQEVGEITIHHHGNHSAPSEDGQPDDHLIARGASRTYEYELMEDGEPERAAFQWYHDHRMDVTARNVWMGLAGMFIIDDEVDAALPLPKGEFDVPLMLTARAFDDDNQLLPVTSGIPPLDGAPEDVVLANGAFHPFLEVAARKYRFRLLNAGTFRGLDLSLSPRRLPMTQIASESGLLPHPVVRESMELDPAQRVEVVVDFSGLLGETVTLESTQGACCVASEIMEFRVSRLAEDDSTVPNDLRPAPVFDTPEVPTQAWVIGVGVHSNPGHPGMLGMPGWTFNGLTFDPARVDATVKLGSTARWLFVNAGEPRTPHIIHIHDVDWMIIARSGAPPPEWERGLIETFLINFGESVEVTSRFTDHVGRYVLHCHMLQHEDHGLMAQFEVVA